MLNPPLLSSLRFQPVGSSDSPTAAASSSRALRKTATADDVLATSRATPNSFIVVQG
jgi:hypothetical protein